MQDGKGFEVRDTREKFFIVDDAYFNGWARKCGDAANLVYMILCRHVGCEQSCFPSIALIADKLGMDRRRVIRAIKMLELYRIIHVSRQVGERSLYFLIDKSNWRDPAPKSIIKRGPAREATRIEKSGVKVTWDGERMRPMSERESL